MTPPECPPGMESVAHLEAHLWPESHTVSTLLRKQWKSEHHTMHYKKRHSQVQSKIQSGLPKANEEVARDQAREASTAHIHCRDELGLPQPPAAPCRPSRSSTQCPKHSTTPDSSTGLSCVVPETLPARTLEFTEKWRPWKAKLIASRPFSQCDRAGI